MACAVAVLAACGDDDAQTVHVYSSLPAHGIDARHGEAVERGIRLALGDAGGRAGDTRVEYRPLVASTRGSGGWEGYAVAGNARRAAADSGAVAYIGEFNSPASAVNMPILNEAGLLQVTPSNTATGLTSADPGAAPGEPESHYPSGRRHFVRLPPRNSLQAAALVTLMLDEGCRRARVAQDGGVYAGELLAPLRLSARDQGLALAGERGRANCLLFAGADPTAARRALTGAREAKLFAADALIAPPRAVPLPEAVERRLLVTAPLVQVETGPPNPYTVYGYEAMRLVLDAIERAGDDGDERGAVVRSAFATQGKRSPFGRYDVEPTGDTTLRTLGVWGVRGGRAAFRRPVEAP